jgi:acetyl-CoA C-acetyltransferase
MSQAAIVGVYEHPTRKAPGVHPFQLQADCVRGALADAGFELSDVGGLCTTALLPSEGGGFMSVIEVAEWLGIQPTYLDSTDTGGAAPVSHVGHAAAAIAAGLAEVVVVSYAAVSSFPSGQVPTAATNTGATGPGQFEVPYGFTVVGSYALAAQRHMHEYGTTPEQLAAIAVTCRSHAATNPDARFREPITIDDVLSSPMISSPLHRLDCCVVTDGGGALVVASAARAKSARHEPAWILGFGESCAQVQMNQMNPLTATPARFSGPRAFAQAGVAPDEIEVAQIYDSFTITLLLALEDLGFCAKGEGGPFVQDGGLTLRGRLPVNTDGGGLSSNHPGRRGIFTVIESVRQLRGDGPGVQVADCRLALAHGTGGSLSSAATLILGRS